MTEPFHPVIYFIKTLISLYLGDLFIPKELIRTNKFFIIGYSLSWEILCLYCVYFH